MPYEYRYYIQSESQIMSRNDGSGAVDHQIQCQSRETDDQGDPIPDAEWTLVPGRNKTFSMPSEEMEDALSQSGINAIVQAYKTMLVTFQDYAPVPIIGWTEDEMTLCLDNNKSASQARTDFFNFLDTLGAAGDFPITFRLDL